MGLLALGWGFLAASAVFIGASIGWRADVPPRWNAGVMAFGSGVLLALIAFDVLGDAYVDGGLDASVIGMFGGALAFTLGLLWLDRNGARDRKRAHTRIDTNRRAAGVVALATVLDGLPELLIIGLNFANGETVALATVIAVFLSNIPEAMSATTRMKRAGRSALYVAGVWAAVAIVGAIATLAGYQFFSETHDEWTAIGQAVAAGALLALLVDTMIPEAFTETHEFAGLMTALGFITGFALTHGLV